MTAPLGPGIFAVTGAAALQETAIGPPPLPGGIAGVLRVLFNLPQWIQITGFVLGVVAAAAVVIVLWRRRHRIVAWIRTRQRGVRVALVAVAAAVLLGMAGFGTVSWNYMQHDNGFCTGCHIMEVPFQRFTGSKHDSLSCHNCHQQSLYASTRQLYLWVADRPEEISMHSKVPTRICAECHIQGDREPERWRRIATTAGHRVHLESDSSALRGIECVTCHGAEVHRFVPASATCAQAGCHVNTEIRLGKMSSQTGLHCAACHRFTADVPLLATTDSAAGTLRPGASQCLACHQMRARLPDFDPARDPHKQTCGMCHNPHVQTRPADALKSCATAACHGDWRAEPFHTGAAHRGVAPRCTTCHQPHAAKVDASDCSGCHAEVNRRSGTRRLPQAFDTTRALRPISWSHPPGPERMKVKGDSPLTPPDTFSHDRHKSLACLTCHTSADPRARLTFEAPRGCQICHHQSAATSNCAQCHAPVELAPVRAVAVQIAAAERPPRDRSASFRHERHATVACVTCHTTPVSLATSAPAKACTACHEDHHAARRDCAQCHAGTGPAPPHTTETHVACDACHRESTVARLVPDRGLCLTCHTGQREHYAERECTTCHFQSSPETFRPQLRKARA
jgi:hypothetical protein